MRPFSVTPRVNKSNGQINISLPKRKLPKSFIKDTRKLKSIRVSIDRWEFE